MTAPYIDEAVFEQTNHLFRWRAFLTSGGYLAPLEDRPQIAARLAQNMRQFVALREKEFVKSAVHNATESAPSLLDWLTKGAESTMSLDITTTPLFGLAITRLVAADAANDLASAAAAVRSLACGRIFIDGFRVQPKRHTYAELVCNEEPTAEEQLDRTLTNRVKRAAMAVQYYDRLLSQYPPLTQKAAAQIVQRLVTTQLDALDAEDARRAQWNEMPPDAPGPGVYVRAIAWPTVQGIILIALTLWFWWAMRQPMPPMERKLSTAVPTVAVDTESIS